VETLIGSRRIVELPTLDQQTRDVLVAEDNRSMRMSWYFALSESSIERDEHDWRGLIRVAVKSAHTNTRLQPIFVYDGQPGEPILSFGMAKKYIDFCASNGIPTHSMTSTG